MLETLEDPLIAYNWQNFTFIASFVLFISIVAMIGFLSRNLENAVFFTVVSSISILLSFLLAAML